MFTHAYRLFVIAGLGLLAACANIPTMQAQHPMKSGAIYIYEPKAPQGFAGPGDFTLTPDGQVHVSGGDHSPPQ